VVKQKIDEAFTLKNKHGKVRLYTRHTTKCPHLGTPNYHDCSCAKWLYAHQKGKAPFRRTLATPSWAEAVTEATSLWEGFHPELAASRLAKAKRKNATTVDDACQMWMKRTEEECGGPPSLEESGGTLSQYQSTVGKFKQWAHSKGLRLIEDVSRAELKAWYRSEEWTRLKASSTRPQRWSSLKSMFTYLVDEEVIENNPIPTRRKVRGRKVKRKDKSQGPYTFEQEVKIFAQTEIAFIPPKTPREEKLVYRQRMWAFLTLLDQTGCDVVDAALHEPRRITEEGNPERTRKRWIYRYVRAKTGVEAVIPLKEHVAHLLRNIPTPPRHVEGMPFRRVGHRLDQLPIMWSKRVARILKDAQVYEVLLPGLGKNGLPRTHKANAKQFRHTFAVRQLNLGMPDEVVARMMGLVDTRMIHEHYAPWVQSRDAAHIEQVLKYDDRNPWLEKATALPGSPSAALDILHPHLLPLDA
jgi:site-specific recombinase XerD